MSNPDKSINNMQDYDKVMNTPNIVIADGPNHKLILISEASIDVFKYF
jgi:hypothetical protein